MFSAAVLGFHSTSSYSVVFHFYLLNINVWSLLFFSFFFLCVCVCVFFCLLLLFFSPLSALCNDQCLAAQPSDPL